MKLASNLTQYAVGQEVGSQDPANFPHPCASVLCGLTFNSNTRQRLTHCICSIFSVKLCELGLLIKELVHFNIDQHLCQKPSVLINLNFTSRKSMCQPDATIHLSNAT